MEPRCLLHAEPHVARCHWLQRHPLPLAGFRPQDDCLALPTDAPLPPLRAAAARLRRLADRKGHSGSAEEVKDSGGGGGGGGKGRRPESKYYGQPGFRWVGGGIVTGWVCEGAGRQSRGPIGAAGMGGKIIFVGSHICPKWGADVGSVLHTWQVARHSAALSRRR